MAQVEERTEQQRYVGGGVLRKEDPELITGQANYVDNISVPGMKWMAMIRSPFAHAGINGIDSAAAEAMPGVQQVFTGADLTDEWADGLPCAWPVTEDIKMPKHWAVTTDKARYAGEIVAVVVADSREQAADAAEVVAVDWEPMDPVLNLEAALDDSGTIIHEDLGSNNSYTWALANGEVDQAFENAEVHVKERYWHPRLIPNAIEPRGIVVQPNPAMGELTMWSATQVPHIVRTTLAMSLGINESKLRIIAPDVGGGFGSKLQVYAEEAIGLALARRLGVPLKWIEGRSENYLASHHGRGVIQDMELAADADGKVAAVRVKEIADMGAYHMLVTPGIPILGAFLYSGLYDVQAYSFECTGVFTNRTPTDAYRGAGRPEATYAIERAMNRLAREVGKDPADIRKLNFIAPFDEPFDNIAGLSLDSGNYERSLDKALEVIDYDGWRAKQKERRDAGGSVQIGIGISTYIEMCGLAPSQVLASLRYAAGGWDAATIRCHPTGKVTVVSGVTPHGQGHDTTWAQIAADALGVDIDDVEVLHGDTAIVPLGMDTYGSRSLSVGGIALHYATEKVIAKAKKVAAHELEVDEEDLEFSDGALRVKGAPDKSRTIPEVALSAWTAHDLPEGLEPGLEETYVFDPPNFTFPSGAHICVVEVDTETGETEVLDYAAVDDCGNQINPMIVRGQVHGGIAQGLAEAFYEEAVYDEVGNLLTSAMATYRVPSAAELPAFKTGSTTTPSTTNPMGVKGVGEAGTIAAPAAGVNAVMDAIHHLGVESIDLACTPEKIWAAIQNARGGEVAATGTEGEGAGAGLGSAHGGDA